LVFDILLYVDLEGNKFPMETEKLDSRKKFLKTIINDVT